MEDKKLTVDEKLDYMNKRLKRMEWSQNIQTAIVLLGFIGVISLSGLVSKIKGKING